MVFIVSRFLRRRVSSLESFSSSPASPPSDFTLARAQLHANRIMRSCALPLSDSETVTNSTFLATSLNMPASGTVLSSLS